MMYHASTLFRFASSVALLLLSVDDGQQKFEATFTDFVHNFRLQDRWLHETWARARPVGDGWTFASGAVEAKLAAYREVRGKWLMVEAGWDEPDGFEAVPVSLSGFYEHGIQTVVALNELEDVLMDALVLGRTQFGASAQQRDPADNTPRAR